MIIRGGHVWCNVSTSVGGRPARTEPTVLIRWDRYWWTTTPTGWRAIVRRALVDQQLDQAALNRLARALEGPPKKIRSARGEDGRRYYFGVDGEINDVSTWSMVDWNKAAEKIDLIIGGK